MDNIKLGKLPVRKDIRTIKLSTILKVIPALPESYNVDVCLGGLTDNNIYANDEYGDCVIAGRAHQTLRFEKFEQDQVIAITDKEVTAEYFSESGGIDSGLYILDSLNKWRQNGWTAAGQKYDIYVYSAVTPANHDEVKASVYLLRGVYCGLLLPLSAQSEYNAAKPWSDTIGAAGTWGGHCVYVFAYDADYLYCMTWGKIQKITWLFWDKYCDEAYCIVDNKDNWLTDSPVDVAALEAVLKDITASESQKVIVTSLSIPSGTVGVEYNAVLSAQGGQSPYTWWIGTGSLPGGLSLLDTGNISGIPAAAGTCTIVFMVKDTAGNGSGVQLTLTIKSAAKKNWLLILLSAVVNFIKQWFTK